MSEQQDIHPVLNTSKVTTKSLTENLSVDLSEKDTADPQQIELGKQRKRSMVSLPSEGEEEDEFLFIRLKKQIKNHWTKIMVNYPHSSMFFKTPTLKNVVANESKAENHELSSSPVKSSVSFSATISSLTSNSSSIAKFEPKLLSYAIKSAFLLPSFSCKRDDEGRRCVPFISSLLQVTN